MGTGVAVDKYRAFIILTAARGLWVLMYWCLRVVLGVARMNFPTLLFVGRVACAVALLVVLVVPVHPAFAVDEAETQYLIAPEDDLAAQYKSDLRSGRVDTIVGYIDQTSADLFAVDKKEKTINAPIGRLNFSLVGALALAVLLIALFVKFGSSGNLFSRNSSKKPVVVKPAQGWGLVAEEVSAATLLAQIRAMANQREALILLLRHSLLSAASATDVRFSRVDTERDAFRRVPTKWPHFSDLQLILRSAELVHYGGRVIAEDAFERCLGAGEKILTKGYSA